MFICIDDLFLFISLSPLLIQLNICYGTGILCLPETTHKMIKELLLYFALLLWFVVPSLAQPTIFVEDMTAENGTQIEVPVKVRNFTSIEAMQFTFDWDDSVLKFIEITDITFPNLPIESFGPSEIQSFVNLVWLAPSNEPQYSVPDGSTVFTILFEVIGEPEAKSDLMFPGQPVANLVILDYEEIDLENQAGMFMVKGPVSSDQVDSIVEQVSSTPNPFKEKTLIQFILKEKVDGLKMTIYNATGNEVLTRTGNYPTGLNEIEITRNLLQGKGIYFFRLEAADFDFTDKLIFH